MRSPSTVNGYPVIRAERTEGRQGYRSGHVILCDRGD